jgi:hypothetical protein
MINPTLASTLVAAIAPIALAEGPENAVIIVDPTSLESMYVANHYKAARAIPDSNVIYMAPGAADLAAFAGANVDGLQGALLNRHLHNHADVIVITPGSPFYVDAPGLITDGCSPIKRLSISSAYATSFFTDLILDGTGYNLQLGYFSANGDPVAFDSNISWLSGNPSENAFAKRYFIGAMLGYDADNGNTIQQTLDMIDRSVAADGTHPEGTFYFMNNTADPDRNVRAPQFPAVIADMTALGHDAVQIVGKLPLGMHDCLGVLSGFASADLDAADFSLVDGAFADHLTSWAATFDNDSQTKVSAWINKGASASAGAVEEPCNYTGKFNFARFHLYYAEGLSIGEAYLRSLAWGPFQNLLYGDPLTRAHTYIPLVNIADLGAGPLSGTVPFTPQATTGHPSADIDSFQLFIDGRPHQTIDPGDDFTIDTTTLDDGYHEFRVVAFDDTPVRASGNAFTDIEVANAGGAFSLAADPTGGTLSTAFDFTIGAFGGRDVDRFRLYQNGRVVGSATVDGDSGMVSVHAVMLGAGDSRVHAEAVLADGDVVRSNPVTVVVADFFEQPNFPIPLAFDNEISVLEDQPFLVELPATYRDLPADATYQIIDAPDHAFVYDNEGPYRVMIAQANGAKSDSFTFKVTTPHGVSNTATVTINYLLNGCNADVNDDATLNILDFVTFQTLFQAGDAAADANHDGILNILDFVAFQQLFQSGCR